MYINNDCSWHIQWMLRNDKYRRYIIKQSVRRICISQAIARSLLEISKSAFLLRGANIIPADAAVESMVTLRWGPCRGKRIGSKRRDRKKLGHREPETTDKKRTIEKDWTPSKRKREIDGYDFQNSRVHSNVPLANFNKKLTSIASKSTHVQYICTYLQFTHGLYETKAILVREARPRKIAYMSSYIILFLCAYWHYGTLVCRWRNWKQLQNGMHVGKNTNSFRDILLQFTTDQKVDF